MMPMLSFDFLAHLVLALLLVSPLQAQLSISFLFCDLRAALTFIHLTYEFVSEKYILNITLLP